MFSVPQLFEKYISDKQTEKARSDYHYKKDYNDMKAEGKAGGKGVAVTMEMERIKANEKIAVNLYNKEAKQLAMKYGLDAAEKNVERTTQSRFNCSSTIGT